MLSNWKQTSRASAFPEQSVLSEGSRSSSVSTLCSLPSTLPERSVTPFPASASNYVPVRSAISPACEERQRIMRPSVSSPELGHCWEKPVLHVKWEKLLQTSEPGRSHVPEQSQTQSPHFCLSTSACKEKDDERKCLVLWSLMCPSQMQVGVIPFMLEDLTRQPDIVLHACNPSTWKTKAGASGVPHETQSLRTNLNLTHAFPPYPDAQLYLSSLLKWSTISETAALRAKLTSSWLTSPTFCGSF